MDKQMTYLSQIIQNARNATIASNHPFATDGQLIAAEIRAIADGMVMRFDPWLAEHAEVAEWLRAEASRAELNLQGKPND